jgi:hypothetical protein
MFQWLKKFLGLEKTKFKPISVAKFNQSNSSSDQQMSAEQIEVIKQVAQKMYMPSVVIPLVPSTQRFREFGGTNQ